ncbi:hypothetical protein MTR62_20275, partial [Novosphingobium sp. 1949]|nr:hypothetical protein [Novosphingobium organovorum]
MPIAFALALGGAPGQAEAATRLASTICISAPDDGAQTKAGDENDAVSARPAARLLAERLKARHFTSSRSGPGCTPIRLEQAEGLGEGFTLTPEGSTRATPGLVLRASMTRGFVYGAGWLLAHLSGRTLDLDAPVHERPAYPVRGDQIGIRAKNNTFDAWDATMLARHVDDLALLGANRVQLIGPVSDDAATSPLAPLPARAAILATARHAHAMGLEVALYLPLLRDYTDPGAVRAEVADLNALLADFPALDAVYFPGGDPGHTAPDVLLRLLAQLAKVIHARFAKAEILVSSQGFDARDFDTFTRHVQQKPDWLSAVFVGPQTRATMAQHHRLLGASISLELYPDTAHTMHAQLPIADWSPAFALTEGREPIDPRPRAMAAAFAAQMPGTRGFVAYSEGVNDDWNLAQWLALGWDPKRSPQAIARAYARLFIGDDRFASLPQALETNWQGDPAQNRTIASTLARIARLKPADWADWRFDLYRYRALYDALVQRRWRAAQQANAAAQAALAKAAQRGSARTAEA